MKKFIPIYLLLFFSMMGCLARQQQPAAPSETEGAAPRALAELHLSIPKTHYTEKEPIPLELSIQTGKFDLLVPFVNVATKRAFAELTIRDANGELVKSKRPITTEAYSKYIMRDGKSVRCIQGFELKAAAHQVVQLEDLQPYYRLQPGNYSIAVALTLEVYRESVIEPHPQVIELERDIRRLQSNRDAALSAAVKTDAINEIQAQIEYIQEKHKAEVRPIYLPVKSRRGKSALLSNTVSLTVE